MQLDFNIKYIGPTSNGQDDIYLSMSIDGKVKHNIGMFSKSHQPMRVTLLDGISQLEDFIRTTELF